MSDHTPHLSLEDAIAQAHQLLERQRYQAAHTHLQNALSLYPGESELLYLQAFTYYRLDADVEALDLVNTVLANEPHYFGARILLANIHESMGEMAKAELMWIALLQDYPEEPELWSNYANLMLFNLQVDKAKALAEEGLRHEPEHAHCLYLASICQTIEGKGDKLNSENLTRLIVNHPERELTNTAILNALLLDRKYVEALPVAQTLLRANPSNPYHLQQVKRISMYQHWSMWPLKPMLRWGWPGALGVTVTGLLLLQFISKVVSKDTHGMLSVLWICYVVYSWLWPTIFMRFDQETR